MECVDKSHKLRNLDVDNAINIHLLLTRELERPERPAH
jgi:hypothetical protein